MAYMMTQPLIVVPVATDSMIAPNSMITASCPYKSHISQSSVTDPLRYPEESKRPAAKVKLYMSLAHPVQVSVLNPLLGRSEEGLHSGNTAKLCI